MSMIAEMAQTSVMTVSRVLNDKPDVSEATRQRVMRIIEQQGYKPHTLARKLSGGKTNIIGLALYTGGTAVVGMYAEILEGLQSGLADHEYDLLMLAPSRSDRYDERVLQNTIMEALVLMGHWMSEDDIIHLRDSEVPFITIGRRDHGTYTAPFVAPDYEKTFCEIIDFAVSNGAKTVDVVVSGVDSVKQSVLPHIRERLSGVSKAREIHNIPEDSISFIPATDYFSDGYDLFYIRERLPDAIVLDSTDFSFGVAMALRDRKLKIHSDIQLLGVDYQSLVIQRCENVLGASIPRWSIPWFDLGQRAVQHLLDMIGGGEGQIREYVNFVRENLYVL